MKDKESSIVRHTINGSNILKHASGVAAGPAGNIIVTSMAHGKIYLFSAEGNYLKTFRTKKMSAPMGIELRGRLFFAVDSKDKVVNAYVVAEVQEEEDAAAA